MKKRRKTVLVVFLILTVLAAAGFAGYEIFKVKTVVVEGNEDTPADEIISMSSIEYGTNIFMVDLEAAKAGIETSPFMECIAITRVLPDTISIQIKERCRRAVVQYLDTYMLIDEDGIILETCDDQMQNSYPLVTGINIMSFQVGSKLQASDMYQIDVLQELLVELHCRNLSQITEVDVSNPVNIMLKYKSGMEVCIGEAKEIANKLARMSAIMTELETQNITDGTIDVSGETGGTYLPSK